MKKLLLALVAVGTLALSAPRQANAAAPERYWVAQCLLPGNFTMYMLAPTARGAVLACLSFGGHPQGVAHYAGPLPF